MPIAAASEKEGSELGTPQTPAGGLRPPAVERCEVALNNRGTGKQIFCCCHSFSLPHAHPREKYSDNIIHGHTNK